MNKAPLPQNPNSSPAPDEWAGPPLVILENLERRFCRCLDRPQNCGLLEKNPTSSTAGRIGFFLGTFHQALLELIRKYNKTALIKFRAPGREDLWKRFGVGGEQAIGKFFRGQPAITKTNPASAWERRGADIFDYLLRGTGSGPPAEDPPPRTPAAGDRWQQVATRLQEFFFRDGGAPKYFLEARSGYTAPFTATEVRAELRWLARERTLHPNEAAKLVWVLGPVGDPQLGVDGYAHTFSQVAAALTECVTAGVDILLVGTKERPDVFGAKAVPAPARDAVFQFLTRHEIVGDSVRILELDAPRDPAPNRKKVSSTPPQIPASTTPPVRWFTAAFPGWWSFSSPTAQWLYLVAHRTEYLYIIHEAAHSEPVLDHDKPLTSSAYAAELAVFKNWLATAEAAARLG
jgi:hypothetical protein